MLSTWKYMLILALAPPAIYAFAPSHLEHIGGVVAKAFTPRPGPSVSKIDPVAAANVDEDLDYRIAQRTKSPEGWRAFLATHPDGPHAQLARGEMDRLMGLALASQPPREGSRPDVKMASEAASAQPPSEGREAATPLADESCSGDEERLEQLSKSPTGDGIIRFLIDLRCEKLRPQVARLAEQLDAKAPTPAAEPAKAAASSALPGAVVSAPPLPPPRMRSDEPQKRPHSTLASRGAEPKRHATGRPASNLPPFLLALFGDGSRSSTAGRRTRTGGH